MPTFLQPITLPERCFLSEVLLWAAFQRLPIASYTLDGKEIRETDEIGGYAVEVVEQMLEEDETQRAGIPKDPALIALLEDKTMLDPSFYDQFLTRNDLDEDVRKQTEADQAEARAYQREREAWHLHYQRAIEYPASRISFLCEAAHYQRREGCSQAMISTKHFLNSRQMTGTSSTFRQPKFRRRSGAYKG